MAAAGLLVVVTLTVSGGPVPPDRTVSSPILLERPPAARSSAVRAPRVRSPEDVVRAYYAALDRRRFAGAWRTLGAPVRARFGAFEAWRAGYATTLASRPRRLEVRRDGREVVVVHELHAADRAPCGTLQRRFQVRWRLVSAGRGWRATALTATRLPGERCRATE